MSEDEVKVYNPVQYTKIRLTNGLAEALTLAAALNRIPRQRLLEGLLAQSLLQICEELKSWENVQVGAGLLGVPRLADGSCAITVVPSKRKMEENDEYPE